MTQLKALIFIKEKEQGLLSITDYREKSLVPVFGGNKIIDYYIGPLISSVFNRILVLSDRDMTGIKDHLVYTYSSNKIRIISESDVYLSLLNLLKLKKNEAMIVLRADGLFFPEWENFTEFLTALPARNYKIVTRNKDTIGFYLREMKFAGKMKALGAGIDQASSKVDQTWEILEEILANSTKSIEYNTRLMKVETAFDYYTVHFSMLNNIKEFSRLRFYPPSVSMTEESLSRIVGTGFVKDSHISSSCTIEGYVESSILFSNVKVGKHAHVMNSIIMSNNYIGDRAVVQNTIVCDNGELFPRVSPNIGESARIGEDDSTGANTLYPGLIHGGVTLIGQNVEIPKGFKVSRNCFIASSVDKGVLRSRIRMKAGDSALNK